MALIQKTNPRGIDIKIDSFQAHLDSALSFTEWDSYHRVYTNPNEGSNLLVPERYDAAGEYQEVFYNDNFDITTWFFVANERPVAPDGYITATVSLIVQANLDKLYPAIAHRADEELNNSFEIASRSFPGRTEFVLESIWTTIDRVYTEFDKAQILLDDMSKQYVVRFNYKVSYTPDCVT